MPIEQGCTLPFCEESTPGHSYIKTQTSLDKGRPARAPHSPPKEMIALKLCAKTDIGLGRAENQDTYRAARLPGGGVWALVCDGMGGARGGKAAAEFAADAIQQEFAAAGQACPSGAEQAFLLSALRTANAQVYRQAQRSPANRGMGTTAVCVLVRDGVAHLAHVGDSRAYLYRDCEIRQLTRDHSVVQEMVERGTITRAEAATHPRKNIITRALGVEPEVEPEYTSRRVFSGDILLLCTDGLTGPLRDESMAAVLANAPFLAAPEVLIQKALAAGGQDNITVLLIGVEDGEG